MTELEKENKRLREIIEKSLDDYLEYYIQTINTITAPTTWTETDQKIIDYEENKKNAEIVKRLKHWNKIVGHSTVTNVDVKDIRYALKEILGEKS